jgi:transcriptional regulator with XRE-family HTH domain
METEERVKELYQRKYSQREVAEKTGMKKHDVRKILEDADITRSRSEATKYRCIRKPVPFRTDSEGYETWWDQTGQQAGKSADTISHHRLLAVAEYGLDEVKDKVIHHKNKIPWDNRPENIELMSVVEHGKLHGKEST